MIGRLRGAVIEKHPPVLVVDVNGVGYELQASMGTFYKLPELSETVTLYTHLIVREDAQTLYGFFEERERLLFRALIKINGVGPKMAITILSSLDPDALLQCVANNDLNSFTRIPGVGKKTAERLMMELRNQLEKLNANLHANVDLNADRSFANDIVQDAISALVSLGYKASDASRVISKIADANLSSEELIRRALQMI